MAAQHLERSVLESKERDELFAIAEALGLKPAPRAKKADLVDNILLATGVEPGAEPPATEEDAPKPRRGRKRAAPAPTDEAPSESADGATAPDEAGGTDAVAAAPEPATTTPPPRQEPAATSAPPKEDPSAPRSAAGQTGANGQPGQPPAPTASEDDGTPRRSRRRRGRERLGVGPAYEQQAQQADQQFSGEATPVSGLLDIRPEGFGFLRARGYLPSQDDVYVSTSQLRRFALRSGDRIEGGSRPASSQEKFPALVRIDTVAGQSPEEARERRSFAELTPVYPEERLPLAAGAPEGPASVTARAVDLVAPIGKGQRALVVAPAGAGTTTFLTHLAQALEVGHPDVDVVVVLVDERPEDLTEVRRSLRAEVIGSTFDRPADEHAHVADLALEMVKRRVEAGRDVVLLLDGLTRLARAHHHSAGSGARNGVDSSAVYAAKRVFGAARCVEEGGSLTIVASAAASPTSSVDTAVEEELQGTATTVIRLDGALAERGAFPAIDVLASSTRHAERLLGDDARAIADLRAALGASDAEAAHERLLERIRHTPDNASLLAAAT